VILLPGVVEPTSVRRCYGRCRRRINEACHASPRSGALETRLGTDFGADAWEAQVRATAMGLGGGSGWVILGLSLHEGSLVISSAGNHPEPGVRRAAPGA
jgi:superoxide dismutase